jgi:hypothetical protein
LAPTSEILLFLYQRLPIRTDDVFNAEQRWHIFHQRRDLEQVEQGHVGLLAGMEDGTVVTGDLFKRLTHGNGLACSCGKWQEHLRHRRPRHTQIARQVGKRQNVHECARHAVHFFSVEGRDAIRKMHALSERFLL